MPSTMANRQRFINWGAYRKGVFSTLPRFDALPNGGFELVRSYQAVLDRNETFTQYFSDKHLESYGIEASLREEFGVGPPCLSDPENPADESAGIISWTTIFRSGDFIEQPDGRYLCHVHGKIVELDERIYRTIMISRRAFPPSSQAWPIHSDVDRELELSMAIEADVVNELNSQIKYVERLHRLQLTMKKRRRGLQRIQDPENVKLEPETESPRPLKAMFPVSTPRPVTSGESHTTRARSSSESSVSSGGDIPSAAAAEDSAQANLGNTALSGVGHSKGKGKYAAPTNSEQKVIHIHDDTSSPLTSLGSAMDPSPSSQFLPVNQSQLKVARNLSTPGPSTTPKRSFDAYSHGDSHPSSGKRQKSAAPSSAKVAGPSSHGQQMPMWNVRFPDSPHQTPSSAKRTAEPEVAPPEKRQKQTTPAQKKSGTRKPEQKKRERHNFTDFEKEHGPPWIRAAMNRGLGGAELQKAYFQHFGTHHHATTLKAFLDRMEAKAKARPAASTNPTSTTEGTTTAPIQPTTELSTNATTELPTKPATNLTPQPNPGEGGGPSTAQKLKATSVGSPVALQGRIDSPTQGTPGTSPSLQGNITPSYVSPYTQLGPSKQTPVKPAVIQSDVSQSGNRASEQPKASPMKNGEDIRSSSAAIAKSPMKNGLPKV
ncbi:hypothetical protein MYU51_016177 [Penicillium brevicompactum]